MTDAEPVLAMLSEAATRQIAEKRCAEGFPNAQAAGEVEAQTKMHARNLKRKQ